MLYPRVGVRGQGLLHRRKDRLKVEPGKFRLVANGRKGRHVECRDWGCDGRGRRYEISLIPSVFSCPLGTRCWGLGRKEKMKAAARKAGASGGRSRV